MTPRRQRLALALGLAGAVACLLRGPAMSQPPLPEPVQWLVDYLRIDTTNPPGNEARAAAYLAGLLHREGIATRTLVTPDGRASLVARLPSPNPRGGPVVLLHHLDVVPPGPGWTAPPFEGMIRGGSLWGRGALDCKSLGVAHLAALVHLKRNRVVLSRDVVLVAVADEENGGLAGTGWLWEHHPEIFAGAEVVLNEGGTLRSRGGKPVWWGIEVAQKRPLWIEVTSRGRSGHGSGWNPGNVNHKLIEALGRLVGRPPRWRVDPPVAAYLAALAPYQGDLFGPVYADIGRHIGADGPRVGLPPGLANLFLDTAQVTVLDAGDRINVIPSEARALLDVRLLPDTDEQAFLLEVERALGDGVDVRLLLTSPRSAPSPIDSFGYRTVERVLGGEAPVVPAFINGFTDSRYFRERGIPAYGVSPFVLEPQEMLTIHGADERIPLIELERGVERMKRIVLALATS